MELIYIGLLFSTLMSWAVSCDLEILDFELPTTWILITLCIPGWLITGILVSPIIFLHSIGWGINKLWFKIKEIDINYRIRKMKEKNGKTLKTSK